MRNLLLAIILAMFATEPCWAKGYFQTTVSAVQVDQNGRISFTTTTDIPAGVSNGCPAAANGFYLGGDRNSPEYKTLLVMLEIAVKSNAPIGIWTDGCNANHNTALYLGLIKHV